MPHDHCHHSPADARDPQAAALARSRLKLAVLVTLAFFIVEAICGYWADSLALLSDAGHNFADAAALAFSCYAAWIAGKPSNHRMTYGYHRVGILAALVNAVSLVVIALLIIWEGIGRVKHPEPPHGMLMIAVASLAVVMNVTISVWLHAGAKTDINVRSAYLHMFGDALSALSVVVAGIIVVATNRAIADPIASFAISLLILVSSWNVLKESVNVLLEGTPFGLDMQSVEATIKSVGGVIDAHDLHVWTIGPGVIACSVHILVKEQSVREGQQILGAVVAELEHHHGIAHATVQVEVEGHEATEMYCTLRVK